jgi:ParB-like chromosome segregation protein Spo0J
VINHRGASVTVANEILAGSAAGAPRARRPERIPAVVRRSDEAALGISLIENIQRRSEPDREASAWRLIEIQLTHEEVATATAARA